MVNKRRFHARDSNFKLSGLGFQVDLVIALVAMFILAGIVGMGVKSFLDNNRAAKARADCAQIGAAVSQYHMEIGELPDGDGPIANNNAFINALTTVDGQYGPWLTRKTGEWYDPWHNSYYYRTSTNGSSTGTDARSFVIYSLGPDKTDDGSNASGGIVPGDIGFWGK